jgi:ferredoxin
MNSENFTCWLNRFFELSSEETRTLNEKQVQIIKDHLALVLHKVTPTTQQHSPPPPPLAGTITVKAFDTDQTHLCKECVVICPESERQHTNGDRRRCPLCKVFCKNLSDMLKKTLYVLLDQDQDLVETFPENSGFDLMFNVKQSTCPSGAIHRATLIVGQEEHEKLQTAPSKLRSATSIKVNKQ